MYRNNKEKIDKALYGFALINSLKSNDPYCASALDKAEDQAFQLIDSDQFGMAMDTISCFIGNVYRGNEYKFHDNSRTISINLKR